MALSSLSKAMDTSTTEHETGTDSDVVGANTAHVRRMLRTGLLVGVAVVAVLVPLVVAVSSFSLTRTTEVVVFDKERVCESGGGACHYLIFTDDTTFQLSDSLLVGRFDSSDDYGQIRRCHRYELTYYGWRVGVLSMYPNIASYTDLGPVEGCEP